VKQTRGTDPPELLPAEGRKASVKRFIRVWRTP
jgi:hypothetical protein